MYIMKMNLSVKGLLRNKYVLYLITIISFIHVIMYINNYQYNALALFLLVGFLSTFFTKNMIIVLGVSLIASHFIYFSSNYIEGMKNKKEEKKTKASKKENLENKKPVVKPTSSSKSKQNKKEKQAFTQNNIPDSEPATIDGELEDAEVGKRIDYASTLEQAYDNLQNILGDKGIQSLTKDTQNLISQQKSLMGTMESMGPMLKMAKDTLNNFNGGEMKDTMNSLKSMMGKFNLSDK